MAEGVRDIVSEHNVCQLCGVLEDLQLCGGCKVTWYCSREHQKYDWKYHRDKCKKNRPKTKSKPAEKGDSLIKPCADMSIRSESGPSESIDTKRDVSLHLTAVETHANTAMPAYRPTANTGNRDLERGTERKVNKPSDIDVTDSYGVRDDQRSSSEEVDNTCRSFRSLDFSVDDISTADTVADTFTAEGSLETFILESDESALCKPNYNLESDANDKDKNMRQQENDAGLSNRQTYLSVVESRNQVLAEYAINCLNRYGICVLDTFLGKSEGLEILQNVQYLHTTGTFSGGQVIDPSTKATKQIRSDMITWVDGTEPGCDKIQFLVASIDAVILQCTGRLGNYDIHGRTKAMVACYPGRGAHYVRHVDNPNRDGRCVTCIYYLNEGWDAKADGGLLRIFPQGQSSVACVEPKFDRLLFFWSDGRNPHEVMPAYKKRYAITVWYYDSVERKRALKRVQRNKHHI